MTSRAQMTLAVLVALASPAVAQPDDAKDETTTDANAIQASRFDPALCREKPRTPTTSAANVNLVTLTDFEIAGQLVDPPDKVRALLAPTMQRHRMLSDDLRDEAAAAAGAIGYYLVGLGTRDTPTGRHAQLHLAPLPMIRRVDVHIKQSLLAGLGTPLFEDEVKRRIRLRQGSYLPWTPDERHCELDDETRRIETFLRDEGYFDAKATIAPKIEGAQATLVVRVELGKAYTVDLSKIYVPDVRRLPVELAKIREKFKLKRRCLIRESFCYGTPRFRRAQHALDLQEVAAMFQALQYPSVRVRSSPVFANPKTHTVEFSITIDPRRRVDVRFEGTTVSDAELRKQLTFDAVQSADDVEATTSARALATYLQSVGYFDAQVTWRREQFQDAGVDHLIYRIAEGRNRSVRAVSFKGSLALEQKVTDAQKRLLEVIATKPVGRTAKLLGATATATSINLFADVERIKALYRREGYRDARVSVSAATDPTALGSAALTAAMLGLERGEDLYVQFQIDAGTPTLINEVHIDFDAKRDQVANDEERALCRELLKELSDLYHVKFDDGSLASSGRCVGTTTNLLYREVEAEDTRDSVKERLFSRGRPRTEVALDPTLISPHRYAIHYRLKNTQPLKVGTIVIRGNFRTRQSIIIGELEHAKFQTGLPLTAAALADSTRGLRNTGLFDSVNIRLLGLDSTTAGALNAVVEVTERYDYRTGLDLEVGGSSFNGVFVKLLPTFRNIGGIGISLETAGTVGVDANDLLNGALTLKQFALEGTLRIPSWLTRRWAGPFETLAPQIDLTGFLRRQDTPRFGVLKTTGVTATLSRTWSRPHVGKQQARARTIGFHYDYRSRERNVDVLRPVGADDDESQVPITTKTGSVGFFGEWEQRVDRSGSLQPLAPENGFRIEGEVSFAHPFLSIYYGQDTFMKFSGVASKYWPVGTNLVLRADARYDHGVPLGGAALLPEVERFFGGGDSTVRGYEDDRLATELIEVGVPPLDNISQIRVLPAGGNIRALGSLDAQLRIYKLLSTAVFADAGLITNQWSTVTTDDIHPSIGMALIRIVTPFGAFAAERAVPLRPRLGDDPRGRWHISFAARAQF